RWSGQVMETVDDLAYLGRNRGNDRICVITGDSGQGMTHATIGACIAADLISGRTNSWAALFDAGRISLMAAGTYALENLNAAAPRPGRRQAPGIYAFPRRSAPLTVLDRLMPGQELAGAIDHRDIDHLAVDRERAAALGLRRPVGLDQFPGVRHFLRLGRKGL